MRAFLAPAFLAALLAAPALAQQPAAPAPGTRQIRLDLSPAGEATVKRFLGTPDPAIAQQAQQLRSLAQQVVTLTGAPRLDVVRLRALMRQQEAAQAAIQHRGNDRMLEMLGQLSDADRLKFVQGFRNAQPAARPPGAR